MPHVDPKKSDPNIPLPSEGGVTSFERDGHRYYVLTEDEYNGLTETAHLTSSSTNAAALDEGTRWAEQTFGKANLVIGPEAEAEQPSTGTSYESVFDGIVRTGGFAGGALSTNATIGLTNRLVGGATADARPDTDFMTIAMDGYKLRLNTYQLKYPLMFSADKSCSILENLQKTIHERVADLIEAEETMKSTIERITSEAAAQPGDEASHSSSGVSSHTSHVRPSHISHSGKYAPSALRNKSNREKKN